MTALKQIKTRTLAALLAVGIGATLVPLGAHAAKKFIAIGTAGPTGIYFVVGNAVCRMVHKSAAKQKLDMRCSAPSTGGSVYNLGAIASGDLDIGVVQSDFQQQAYQGMGKFEDKKLDKLRALFSVYPEPFHILVGKNSGIKTWGDLAGKRVNIGNPGSGQRGTFEALMMANNVDASYFGKTLELTSTEQSKALCDGSIDAYGYTVGVPNAGVAQATDGCGARIISLTGKKIDRMVADNPFFAHAVIPKGTYTTLKGDAKTFGVMATLVTSTNISDEKAYWVVKAVFENIEEFRKLHPAFAHLNPKKMISNGLSAPLHPGAVRYYKEKGWIE